MVTAINLIPTVSQVPDLSTVGITLSSSDAKLIRESKSISGGAWTATISFAIPRRIKNFYVKTNSYMESATLTCYYKGEQIFTKTDSERVSGYKSTASIDTDVVADRVSLRIGMRYSNEQMNLAILTGFEPVHIIQSGDVCYTLSTDGALIMLDNKNVDDKDIFENNGFVQRYLKKNSLDSLKNLPGFKILTYFPWKE